MVYQSEKLTLNSVMDVFKGDVNDVVICENVKDGRSTYYTLLIIKKHDITKKIIRLFEHAKDNNGFSVDMFSVRNDFCIAFEYVKERRLDSFYMPEEMPLDICEKICLSLLIQCMTTKLPYPILYLILEQNQIHLLQDNTVSLGYCIDLQGIDEEVDEAKCAMKCALIIRGLLEKKKLRNNISYNLLLKKIPKQRYKTFREIYKDILLSSSSTQKRTIRQKVKDVWARNKGAAFRTCMIMAMALAGLALMMIVSQAIWGDIPLLRFFSNSFEQIGTELLVK